ncbi:SHOCT domain-containing protein [Natronorarus salvus]|uniref:SHOCT domain-containing protein n=1 Tax=Natronorarus salvus TaxID=3117733 RepID=UPI002F265DBE
MSEPFSPKERPTDAAFFLVLAATLATVLVGFGPSFAVLAIGLLVVVPAVELLWGDGKSKLWDEGLWDEHVGDWNGWGLPGDRPDRLMRGETDGERTDAVSAERTVQPGSKREELARLRERYAVGEITDAEFERELERLIDVDSREDERERSYLPETER